MSLSFDSQTLFALVALRELSISITGMAPSRPGQAYKFRILQVTFNKLMTTAVSNNQRATAVAQVNITAWVSGLRELLFRQDALPSLSKDSMLRSASGGNQDPCPIVASSQPLIT